MTSRWSMLAAVVAASVLGVGVGSRQTAFTLAGPGSGLRWATWGLAVTAAVLAAFAPAPAAVRGWTVAAGCAVVLEEAVGPAAPTGWAAAIALVAAGALACCVAAAATSPSMAVHRRDLHTIAVLGAVVVGPLAALFVDPHAGGCLECQPNPIAIADRPATADVIAMAGALIALAVAATTLARLVLPGGRSGHAWRDAIPAAAASAATIVLALPRLTDGADGAATGGWRAVGSAGIAALASALWWPRIEDVRRRSALAKLVSGAAAATAHGRIEDALRIVTGDPGMTLRYRLGDDLIDATGTRTPQADGQAIEIVHDGAAIALLTPTVAVYVDRHQIDLISTTAGLAIAHEREAAVLAARRRSVTRVRRDVIAAADLERRQLERELHDHAQQRLVSIIIDLRMSAAREIDVEAVALLESAIVDVQRALDDVRDIAHGIFPAVLFEEGLQDALEELALESHGRVEFDTSQLTRTAPVVEATAYLIAVECARHATASPVAVSVVTNSDLLTLQATVGDVPDHWFASVQARTIALGGQWRREGPALEVCLPCGY